MAIIDTDSNVSQVIPSLVQAGIKTVGRYYSTTRMSKVLTPHEAALLSAADISIFTVFENFASPRRDRATGIFDAQIALQQAGQVGQPHGSAIYFAFDSELDDDAVPGVLDYFHGVNAVLAGAYKVGVYCDGVIATALLDAGLVSYVWLSASRGFPGSTDFYRSRRWSLAQDPRIDQKLFGLSVDFNESNGPFGDFKLMGASAVASAAATDTGGRAANLQLVAGTGVLSADAPAVATAAAVAGSAGPVGSAGGNFYRDVISADPRFHSTKRIADPAMLEPETRRRVDAIIADARQHGMELMIFETYRSAERQAQLFQQGATKLKAVGVHHFGLACDIVKNVGGEPSWKGDFSLLAYLAKQHGLVSGATWGEPGIKHSFVDDDHVQRCTIGRQAGLFAGTWYPDAAYDPYQDGAS